MRPRFLVPRRYSWGRATAETRFVVRPRSASGQPPPLDAVAGPKACFFELRRLSLWPPKCVVLGNKHHVRGTSGALVTVRKARYFFIQEPQNLSCCDAVNWESREQLHWSPSWSAKSSKSYRNALWHSMSWERTLFVSFRPLLMDSKSSSNKFGRTITA